MREFFIWCGVAVCLFSLWAIGRHDWLRLTRRSLRATATVTGYRSSREDGRVTYAPVLRFEFEGREHEVVDAVYSARRTPGEGTQMEVRWPEGRPDLARPPRLAMWVAVYALLAGMAGLLTGLGLGWIADR
jgi:hypothetical protein